MSEDLHRAVRSCDVPQIQDILQRDPSCVNDRDSNYRTPLHVLSGYDDNPSEEKKNARLLVAEILLDHGADVNAQRTDLETPLHSALQYEQIELAKLYLKNGANPSMRDDRKFTALHYAVNRGNEMIELLLQYKVEINVVNNYDETALDIAMRCIELGVTQTLINAGAKANNILNTVFHKEKDCKTDYTPILRLLIQHKKKIFIDGPLSTKDLYFRCLELSNHVKMFEVVLLEQGIDVDRLKSKREGWTDLHSEIDNEYRVQHLLDDGANVNAKTVLKKTPLHILLQKNDKAVGYNTADKVYRIAKKLVEAGADLCARDYKNVTPFQLAVYGNFKMVESLILAQIAQVDESTLNIPRLIDFASRDDVCPLNNAVALGHEEAVDNLLELQHHIEIKNSPVYDPPLYYAIEGRQYNITKMLLEAGCRFDDYCSRGLFENIYEEYQGFDPYDTPPPRYTLDLDEMDIKLICLLWEFNDVKVIQRTLITIIFKGCDPDELICLLMFYIAMGLRMKEFSKNFKSMENFIKLSRPKFKGVLEMCKKELEESKTVKMKNGSSVYDILMKPLDSLVEFIKDKANFNACKNFNCKKNLLEDLNSFAEFKRTLQDPYFTYYRSCKRVLKCRIELAIEKRNLLDRAKDRFNEAIGGLLRPNYRSLPDEITWKIFKNLNVRELKKIAFDEYLVSHVKKVAREKNVFCDDEHHYLRFNGFSDLSRYLRYGRIQE